ncbi:MAG: hypothetical protein ACJAZ2_002308 [Glaciecola sp.]|jgi:hypothetical protein
MTTLYQGSFLSTVLIIVAIYYVGKFLLKWWIKRKVSSHAQRMKGSVNQTEANYRRKAEGHVSIKQEQPKKSSGGAASSGDYVDFEEVD